MSAFIARDFDGLRDLPGLFGPLLPLLPRLDVADLLGQHHGRWVGWGCWVSTTGGFGMRENTFPWSQLRHLYA